MRQSRLCRLGRLRCVSLSQWLKEKRRGREVPQKDQDLRRLRGSSKCHSLGFRVVEVGLWVSDYALHWGIGADLHIVGTISTFSSEPSFSSGSVTNTGANPNDNLSALSTPIIQFAVRCVPLPSSIRDFLARARRRGVLGWLTRLASGSRQRQWQQC